jgi:uncharacterized membrane protein
MGFLGSLGVIALILVVVAVWFSPLILAAIAFVRSGRIKALEERLRRLEGMPIPKEPEEVAEIVEVAPAPIVKPTTSRPRWRPRLPATEIDWESLIGRRALGWIAVVLMIFGAAFFLRYAIQNQWIGPLGRVALAAAAGMALTIGGRVYYGRGWPNFAAMLTAAGLVLFYLATYTAFGFYHLIPQDRAAVFLFCIVVESMALAVVYDRMALALMAILGGLLTPVLMRSEHDQYVAFFTYLVILDAGVVVLATWRDWPTIATVALLGTQALFWPWHAANIHPEKRLAALVFQVVVFALFLVHGLIAQHVRRRVGWQELGRWLANASLAFLAFYVLLRPEYEPWLGSLAVALAGLYAGLARWMLGRRREDDELFLATLAIAAGFIALAFPVQADAPWIAAGWAVEASALWWFGLRLQAPTLRVLAAILAALAVGRVAFHDTFTPIQEPFLPIINRYATPALAVAGCLLASLASTRRLVGRVGHAEKVVVSVVEIVGVLLLGLILSVDLYRYFESLGRANPGELVFWSRVAPTSLSVLWAAYATVLLAVGFRFRRSWLRWTALGIFALDVAKVFLIDLAGLDELYRVLAFFVLAIALGLAARAYQGSRPARGPLDLMGGSKP